MAAQMWLVVQRGELTEATSAELQRFIRSRGGVILMVTRRGPLALLDNDEAPGVERHSLVEFLGPVYLNPRGLAADRLERIFVDNMSKQVDLGRLAEIDAGVNP